MSEVPYDPNLYFYKGEIAMSARLWTSGFNIYAPNRLLLFHPYKTERKEKEHSATHWGDHSNWHHYNLRALERVHHCLAVSTTPQRQSFASMITRKNLNPLD